MTKTNTMILTDFEVVNDIMHKNTFLKFCFGNKNTSFFEPNEGYVFYTILSCAVPSGKVHAKKAGNSDHI